uniref:Uncharacterized protein n=1 Tax=Arundo donax TaxID=35708 RepID=A0A0A9G9E8_ARUDO
MDAATDSGDEDPTHGIAPPPERGQIGPGAAMVVAVGAAGLGSAVPLPPAQGVLHAPPLSWEPPQVRGIQAPPLARGPSLRLDLPGAYSRWALVGAKVGRASPIQPCSSISSMSDNTNRTSLQQLT